MKHVVFGILALVLLRQEVPWTPFNDPENRRHAAPPSAFDVQHYKLSIKILDDKKEIEGTAAIDVILTSETDRIDFDAEDMEIKRVSVDQREVKHALRDRKLTLHFDAKRSKDSKVHVDIDYVGRPKHGMFFIEPDGASPTKPRMVWTQGETNYNHHWFPCRDFPDDKATSEILVTVKKGWTTVSNGELVSTNEAGDWTTFHWKMETPHTSYLSSIVAGTFDQVEETVTLGKRKIPVQYFVPKGLHTEEEIRHTFCRTPDMLRFYSDKTGTPYPYAKYAQAVVVDFIWGGMENISATTLHGYTVVPKRAWLDKDSDGLIAHELAHQWFGDLVTCKSWAHIWINEGFATYFGALWAEKMGGRQALLDELEGGLGWYLGESQRYRRPTVCDCYTFSDDMFDSHTYPRGAWVLHMLRSQLGDELWWKGIEHFLKRHGGRSVTTEDFQTAMEEASGRSLKEFFDQWLYKVGNPEFKVVQQWDNDAKKLSLTVSQEQPIHKLKYLDLETERPIYKVPIDVEIETESGKVLKRIEITKQTETFGFALESRPRIVDFDRDECVLKTVTFEKTMEELIYQLEHDDQPWQVWWAAKQLSGKEAAVEALARSLNGDPSPYVRRAAAESLGAMKSDAARKALLAVVKGPRAKQLREAIEAIGEKTSPLYTRKVREMGHILASVKALSNFAADFRVAKALQDIATSEESTPAFKEAAAAALGKSGKGAFDALSELAVQYEKDELVMPGVLSGMLDSGDPNADEVFMKCTALTAHPFIRSRAMQCLGDFTAKQPKSEKRYPVNLKRLVELLDDSNFRVRRGVIDKIAACADASTIPAIEKRTAIETDMRLVKSLREAVRKIKAPPPPPKEK